MDINYHLTEEDYLQFSLFHAKHSGVVQKALNIQRFVIPVLFLAVSYFLPKIMDIPFLASFIPFLIIAILWLIFYPKYFFNYMKRNTKKLLKEGKNEGLLGEHWMNLSDIGIVDRTAQGETQVTWSGIQVWKEGEEAIYLYNSSVSAYILPKGDLQNIEETKAFIQTQLGKAKSTLDI